MIDPGVPDFVIGDIVWANGHAALGLPYRAKIEDLRDGKARVRPLVGERVLTAGSAKSMRSKYKKGPSIRARWVDARWLKKAE